MNLFRKSFLSTSAVVLSLTASLASAGYFYEATTTTTSDGMGGNEKTYVTVWVEGDRTRIEFKEGNNVGMFGPGNYLISTDAGENLFLVNPTEKTYAPFNLGEMMNSANSIMKGMGGMFKMEFADFHVEKVSEEPGGNILGYDTRLIKFKSGYKMLMSVMGRNMNQEVKMTQEMWTTSEIDAAAFSAWLRPDKLVKGMIEGLDEVMEAQFSQLKGAPLKALVETVSSDDKGRQTTSVMINEVTTLREETIPASTFDIPADYTETELVAALSDDNNSDDGEKGLSKLKGLFKRK